ncbi:MAG: FoF1 ATP synthase subunit delta/epsilon [Bacteroidota bacterium]
MLQVEVISPEKTLFKGESSLVQVPGAKGSFQILNMHAPIISTLVEGKVRVVGVRGKEEFFEISSGVVECHDNKIIILVEK